MSKSSFQMLDDGKETEEVEFEKCPQHLLEQEPEDQGETDEVENEKR